MTAPHSPSGAFTLMPEEVSVTHLLLFKSITKFIWFFFLGRKEDDVLLIPLWLPTLLSTSVSDGGESARAGTLPISAAAARWAGETGDRRAD